MFLRLKTKNSILAVGSLVFSKKPRSVNFNFLSEEDKEKIESLLHQNILLIDTEDSLKETVEVEKPLLRFVKEKDLKDKKNLLENIEILKEEEQEEYYVIFNGVGMIKKDSVLKLLNDINKEDDLSGLFLKKRGREDAEIKALFDKIKEKDQGLGKIKWQYFLFLLIPLMALLMFLLK